jgi:hypothetical protein
MPFDPDEYLKKNDTGFDPDQYLKSQDPTSSFADEAPKRAWGSLLAPVAAVSEFADTYVGAPLRAGVKKAQDLSVEEQNQGTNWVPPKAFAFENVPEIAGAVAGQFGKDPTTAPTWGKLMGNYGVSEKPIPVPDLENFGNPNARFKEGKSSLADITGALVGTAADPTTYLPGPNFAKRAGQGLEMGVKGASAIADPALQKVTHQVFSIKPEVYNYYKKNQGRLKGMKWEGTGKIRDEMLDAADTVRNKVVVANLERKQAEKALNDGVKRIRKQLEPNAQVSPEHLDTIQNLIDKVDREKALQLDRLADAELDKLPIVGPKEDLQGIIMAEANQILDSNEVAGATKAKLENLAKKLDGIYGDYLSGRQIREWIQSLNPILDYKGDVGAIDSAYNAALKRIRKTAQDGLKKVGERETGNPSPYRKIMDEMHTRRSATEEIAELFGKEKSGVTNLQTLYKDANPAQRQLIERKLRNWADTNGYQQVNEMLDEIAKFRGEIDELDLAGPKAYENYQSELGPEVERFNNADLDLMERQNQAKQINRISQDSAHNLIDNIGQFHGGTPPNVDQLKALEEMSGKSFTQDIKDQGALLQFNVERPQGSRITTPMTLLGGGAAALSGDPAIGAALSGGAFLAGTAMDKRGGPIARFLIDKSMSAKQAMTGLAQKMQNPSPGFQKYASQLADIAAQRGTQGLVLYHQLLWNNDPEYRKAFAEEP